jgi:hypothetical protein
MANLFVDLPLPVGNGTGPSVDVSALGANKTFQVSGGVYGGSITIEGSNDGGTTWVPLVSFAAPMGKRTLDCAVQFMRTRVSNFTVGTLPASCAVSSNDDGGSFANLAATAGDGTGANTDVSALGTFNTVIVSGTFTGTVAIEISDDGTDFVECMLFSGPGFQSKRFTAQFMRVTRKAVDTANAGLPVVNVGAISDASGAASAINATYKLASPAPDSGNTSRLLSLTGVASPALTLQTVHAKRAGHVTGLSAFIEPGITNAGEEIQLNVQISTDGGATWNPLNAGTLIAGPIANGQDRAIATFAIDAANAFAADDLLRLEGAYVGTDSTYSGDLSGEIEVAYS